MERDRLDVEIEQDADWRNRLEARLAKMDTPPMLSGTRCPQTGGGHVFTLDPYIERTICSSCDNIIVVR
jgi:hypothetical protein